MVFDATGKNRIKKALVGVSIWLAVLAICAALVSAEDATALQPAQEQPSAEAVEVAAESTAPTAAVESVAIDQTPKADVPTIQTISFKKDMPIRDALRMLAQMYQKNIVPSAKVDGVVTVSNLYDVTFEEALQAILGTHKYEIKGNFIKVYTNEEFMADKTRFENAVIELYFINGEEAKKLVEPLLSDWGKLGVTTPALKDMQAGKGGDSLAIRDILTVTDYPEKTKAIREMIAKVDKQPPQVLIEVAVLEAKLNETTKFGIDFRMLNLDLDSSGTLNLGDRGISQSGFSNNIVEDGGLRVGIVNDRLDVILTALDNITDATLLANTKILALNKQAGHVMIGNRVGYVTVSNIGPEGATQTVQFLEGGTRLAFRPFVCDNGLIRMEINPKQSDPKTEVKGGYVLPFESTTEVTTNVMVRDGKTIVLGGLFKEKTTLGRNQVPVLGDLPVVGNLFRRSVDESERVELIVLLTPHIINEPEQADGTLRQADVERLAWRARQNLFPLHRAKLDEWRYANAVRLYHNGDLSGALAELNSPFASDRTYLDPIRLRERIIRQQSANPDEQIERILLGNLEKEQSGKWYRR